MPTQRGKAQKIIEQTPSGPEPIPQSPVLLVINPSGREASRPADELKSELKQVQIDSVADACRKFKVTIEGTYKDVDGNPVQVCFPAVDESSFTPDGLTRGDSRLFEYHVTAMLCDQLAGNPGASLSEDGVKALDQVADLLEKSLEDQS